MNFSGKVLIVDDEARIREFVGQIVKSFGRTTVVEAPDGEAALRVFDLERPDLVLLDIIMPGLDGIQTLQRLRQHDPDCLVVMLTSLVSLQTEQDCLRLGATGYLRKDLPPQEITAELSKIIADCFGDGTPPVPAS